jgi:hypothetical protein
VQGSSGSGGPAASDTDASKHAESAHPPPRSAAGGTAAAGPALVPAAVAEGTEPALMPVAPADGARPEKKRSSDDCMVLCHVEPELSAGPAKRMRPSPDTAHTPAPVDAPAPVDMAAVEAAHAEEEYAESPFALMWIRMRMPWPYNHGAFGVKLRQVVTGSIKLAVVSNYMVDFKWLVSACPALLKASQVIVMHGDASGRVRCAVAESKVPSTCQVCPSSYHGLQFTMRCDLHAGVLPV